MIVNWALKMNHSSAQLMNLPDELLLIILKKLDNVDVLCSLMGSDVRLDQYRSWSLFYGGNQLDQTQWRWEMCTKRTHASIDSVRTSCQRYIITSNAWKSNRLWWSVYFWQLIIPIYLNLTFSFLTQNPSYVSTVSQHWHFHLLGHHLCMITDPLLVRACKRRFSLSLSLHAIHARSSSKEDRWVESFSDRHVEDYSEKDRTSNQIEIDVELDGLVEGWVEKIIVLGLDARVDDHCHHIEIVHHTTQSEGQTAVLFWFRWIISHPSIQRSNLDNIS